jgi:hypothetical protein
MAARVAGYKPGMSDPQDFEGPPEIQLPPEAQPLLRTASRV